MIFSVIIPTFNRYDKLLTVLTALEMQSFDKNDFEVIIVDDGSTQPEYKKLIYFHDKFTFKLICLVQQNRGAAAARNLGIDNAQGKYILFIGDDTYPETNLLNEHLKTHQSNEKEIIVLGFIDWDRNLQLNDLMKFLAPQGPQFDFRIKNIENVGYRRFYTSNISIPAYILKNEKFYEGFPGCGLEDIELGYRLEKKGYKIFYNKNAIVYHDHYYESEEFFVKRQELVGRNKRVLLRRHPELNNLWSNKVFLNLILIKNYISIFISRFFKNKNIYFSAILERAWVKAFLK